MVRSRQPLVGGFLLGVSSLGFVELNAGRYCNFAEITEIVQ